MTEHKEACCSSPAAMCYWLAASLIAWGVFSIIGIYWRPLHALSAATILLAMAIGCVANWPEIGLCIASSPRHYSCSLPLGS